MPLRTGAPFSRKGEVIHYCHQQYHARTIFVSPEEARAVQSMRLRHAADLPAGVQERICGGKSCVRPFAGRQSGDSVPHR